MSNFEDLIRIKTLEKTLYDNNNKLRFLERANDSLIEQKKQLKGLLLECREFFVGNKTFARDNGCTMAAIEAQQWITKIDEVLKNIEAWFTGLVGTLNNECAEHNKNVPVGGFESAFKQHAERINTALDKIKDR